MLITNGIKPKTFDRVNWKCDLCGKDGNSVYKDLSERLKEKNGHIFCRPCSRSGLLKHNSFDIAKNVFEYVKQNPTEGFSSIARKFDISKDHVRPVWKLLGEREEVVEKRQRLFYKFITKDSIEKWWLMGLLITDGNLFKRNNWSPILSYTTCDKDVFDKTLNILPIRDGVTVGFREKEIKRNKRYSWSLTISKETEEYLKTISIVPRKTSIRFLGNVPKIYFSHF